MIDWIIGQIVELAFGLFMITIILFSVSWVAFFAAIPIAMIWWMFW